MDLTTVRVDEDSRARDLSLMVAAFCQRPGQAEARAAGERPRELRQIRPPANGAALLGAAFMQTLFMAICKLFLSNRSNTMV